jgi:hypothetical protein
MIHILTVDIIIASILTVDIFIVDILTVDILVVDILEVSVATYVAPTNHIWQQPFAVNVSLAWHRELSDKKRNLTNPTIHLDRDRLIQVVFHVFVAAKRKKAEQTKISWSQS